ncbi:cell division protein FtsW [Desulfonema ishimotonii]|uniref:Probable peptidoglycan glycosyltransferase FtsW n=1 Tax=Desulfonema ishimotonii TaxID=45657 RepID=A0A401FYF8_9BACT|nr:putative lipid II flippase FtsW [Desulfonema ishimotonii]GBC61984.1 cell division protein FtsW [Desulfonema ishimotonii]
MRLPAVRSTENVRPGPVLPGGGLLLPTLVLVGMGMVMVYSASSALALEKGFGSDTYFLRRQVIFSAVGLGGLLFCRWFPAAWFRILAYPILGLSLISLVAVLIPGMGVSAGGALRWLKIGSFTSQPSEFARFALVVYLAYSMSGKRYKLKQFSVGFVPHVIVLGIFTLLIMRQPDFGTAVILFCITWTMMFVAGVPLKHLGLSLAILSPVVLFFMTSATYRLRRLMSFWDPWQYASDAGYQIVHSLMAFGTGGISGVGLGKGYQKLFYLPEPHTDFIFSVIGEELGLLGVFAVLCCYGLILRKGTRIAMNADSLFKSLLAAGLTISMGLQICINMGVALALLPTKGLTLPFLSYGGTSLVMNMAYIGILMNIGATQTHEQTA